MEFLAGLPFEELTELAFFRFLEQGQEFFFHVRQARVRGFQVFRTFQVLMVLMVHGLLVFLILKQLQLVVCFVSHHLRRDVRIYHRPDRGPGGD